MHPAPSIIKQSLFSQSRGSLIALTLVGVLAATAPGTARPATINVSDVAGLYAAVNDPGNAGAKLVLAAGHYVLTVRDTAGALRLNGGRLELQPGMSLWGTSGHPANVVIDASGMRSAGGVIRIGRSYETIEWLTVRGSASADACIETDLVGESTTTLRIAHSIMGGSKRGIDVRNVGPACAGRTIILELDDNELTGNTAGNGQGIRLVNSNANGAAISASLHGNHSHHNLTGCLAANLASSGASIDIISHDDSFDSNVVGCVLFGGITQTAAAIANDNTITFVAEAGGITHNVGVLAPDGDMGGLIAVGGLGAVPGATSRNLVQATIRGMRFGGNDRFDVSAWGARTIAAAPAGTNNMVTIELQGVSKQAVAVATQSKPDEPAGTNSATIVQ